MECEKLTKSHEILRIGMLLKSHLCLGLDSSHFRSFSHEESGGKSLSWKIDRPSRKFITLGTLKTMSLIIGYK